MITRLPLIAGLSCAMAGVFPATPVAAAPAPSATKAAESAAAKPAPATPAAAKPAAGGAAPAPKPRPAVPAAPVAIEPEAERDRIVQSILIEGAANVKPSDI